MAVTEFALLRLRQDGHNNPDLLESLLQCIEVQDQWIDRHQPHLRETDHNLSHVYLQRSGSEPCLLITAPWDSPEGHQEWIQSQENQEAMTGLITPFLAEGDSVDLFHMEPAGHNTQLLLRDVLPLTPFNVTRLSVKPENREAVQQEYQDIENSLTRTNSSRQIWAGWRIEKTEAADCLVVFWNPVAQSDEIQTFLRKHELQDNRMFRCIGHENSGVYKL